MTAFRNLALAAPILCAALPTGEEVLGNRGGAWVPDVPRRHETRHETNVWLGQGDVESGDTEVARAIERNNLLRPPRVQVAAAAPMTPLLGDGFLRVGSVAILEGDEITTSRQGPGLAMMYNNLAAVSNRFLAAYGDEYDQVAMFLAFADLASQQSLAYQMPVKNDIQGIGLGLFDNSGKFGSTGKLETVLNMKRITLYGRDAENDPASDLYSIWAQEAAHRWLVYFKFQRAGDAGSDADLLGRQSAHWTRWVQSDGSFMDGITWKDNGDGTFTSVDANKRYGALDQYGMGLRKEDEVPPFFFLRNVRDLEDKPVTAPSRGRTYKADRVALTIKDIVRAMGARDPATSVAAQDLRMGVVLVTPPGSGTERYVGEAFRIDNTRRLWDDYYNAAGGGRGKVCTELLRPCRGPSFTYEIMDVAEDPAGADKDGIVSPGEKFTVKVSVTNAGSEVGRAKVDVLADTHVRLSASSVQTSMLAPGKSEAMVLYGNLPFGTPCGQPLAIAWSAPGRLGVSKARDSFVAGLRTVEIDTLEATGTAAAWHIDPEGKDTATRGIWELGAPARTVAFEFTLQPQGAWSGQHAFVTGLSGAADSSDQNVDDGFTTLESPPFSVAGLGQPYLAYRVYFVSADFRNEVLLPDPADSLKVLASPDGTTWTEIDRLSGMAQGWQRRLIKLSGVEAGPLRFRFVAEDGGVDKNVVEAVIDDVGIVAETAACAQPAGPGDGAAGAGPDGGAGCACATGGRATGDQHIGAGVFILFAWAVAFRRKQRP